MKNIPKINNSEVYLNIENRGGSVEHYYHFLLGFLVPLVGKMELKSGKNFIVRSCGPLDCIINSLNYENISIVDKFAHKKVIEEAKFQSLKFTVEDLIGFDHPNCYNLSIFLNFNRMIENSMRRLNHCGGGVAKSTPKTILVKRSHHDFYKAGGPAEIFSSGIQRRSIPNFLELELSLRSRFSEFQTVILENANFFDQVNLFRSANIIVAQHGAALSNLIFCRPGTKVYEILPDDLPAESKTYFKSLAKCMGLHYEQIYQEHSHSDVDLKNLIRAL